LRCLGFVASALLGGALAGAAQPDADQLASMSLEDLMRMRIESVYGASKYEQKVTRAPASVTIITAEDIQRFGHRTLADVLRSVRGLYVSNDRNYSYLGVRGFLRPGDYNTRVLVLIDGHRMNDNLYDATYFGRDGLVDIDSVERIEFVRGPSSSIYGSSAFFGVINIVTKNAAELAGARMSVGGGSLGSYEGRLSYGAVLRDAFEVSLSTTFFSSDGHRRLYYPEFDPARSSDIRAADGGVVRNLDAEQAAGVRGSVKYGELTLSGMLLRRSKDVPTASFGAAFNSPEDTVDQRDFLDLKYEHAFARDLRLLGHVSYDRYAYDGHYVYDYSELGDRTELVANRDEARGNWIGTEWQVTRTIADRHTLVVGAEYRQSLEQRQRNFDEVEPRVNAVDDDSREHNVALFGQAELALGSQLLLNAGLRFDSYSDSFGSTVNPRLGLIYSPREKTTLKALYGQAFRAPSAYERFYYEAPPGTPALEPETIRTSELVLEQYLGKRDRIGVSLYHYDVGGLITQQADADDNIYFVNLTRVTADGVELEAERKYESGAVVRASYALQRTEDSDTGRGLTGSPRHLAKLNWGLPLGSLARSGLELQYHGRMTTLAGEHTAGFLITNLNLSSEKLPFGLQASASLYNLFDTQYGYAGAEDHLQDVLSQDGRTFYVVLSRKF
jgi:iron complex outermembrane receptor protein